MVTPPAIATQSHALLRYLSPAVKGIVARETPIPTIAGRAGQLQRERPELVRGDIGQIVGLDPAREVLYGPPVGIEPLRQVIADTWNHAFDLDGGTLAHLPDGLTAQHVAVCSGAAEGLSLLFHCLGAGRTIGLPVAHWENYRNGVELAGAEAVTVEFFDAHGELAIDALDAAVGAHDLRALVVNFPCNPTGAVLSDVESEALARLAIDRDLVLIADEVYARLRFDGAAPHTLLRDAPHHAISVSSASKEYLLPGARVGFVLSAHHELTDRVLRKVIRANTASPNVLGQRELLDRMRADLEDLHAGRPPALLSRIQNEVRARRDLLLAVLGKHGFEPVGRPGRLPEGTIFLMAGLPAWWKDSDVAFSEAALEAACVSSVPGSAFGVPGSIRLSYGAMTRDDIERLDAGLERFRASL